MIVSLVPGKRAEPIHIHINHYITMIIVGKAIISRSIWYKSGMLDPIALLTFVGFISVPMSGGSYS
jgi:hypothetical protein